MSRVLVIGDTHCPVMIDGYVDFLKDIKRKHKTDAVVHIGDVVDFGVFIYDLFATKYSDRTLPDDLRQLSLGELKGGVTFAELGLLLQSIFRGDVGFMNDIAEWFTEAQQQSGSGLSAKQGDIKTIQL